jgi:hypothetical protein
MKDNAKAYSTNRIRDALQGSGLKMCGAELRLHSSAKIDPSFGHFCLSFLRSLRFFAAISFCLVFAPLRPWPT